MPKMQTTIRLEEEDYKQAREILEFVGMSYAQAINIFNRMVVLNHGLPFDAKIPNKKTLAAMKEAKELKGEFTTLDALKSERAAVSN
ncbi:MAG: type II toxin-antitoxin system RelB/DinJ family antitoxin [Sulfuricurvum sp.]|uniref:type II toxin-antitoxin system RelB/DinJ family antitoxin n=1 Tax=Sulfuricurvum sp. TaxID=2025608 RepID=UPI0025E1228E|nr:type II toxin-antitoxin system RelB/DinJ family antitoxin [Sulfuricurvum sp.]MCK9372324.1 type II toxin-antitoxin system RelB/DinJ family antitoxin [Sulfuricurvum sp.]